MKLKRITRRQFTRSLLTATGGIAIAPALLRGQNLNQKLNIGIIGVHSRGAANLASVATENIVALCDVDENYLAEAAQKHLQAKTYSDWRKLLEQKDMDAVIASTNISSIAQFIDIASASLSQRFYRAVTP